MITSRQMLPGLAPKQTTHNSIAYAILGAKFLRGNVALLVTISYLYHLGSGQFGKVMILAVTMATLCHIVGHIVGVRSKKQVRRIDARGVVALMANHHTGWGAFILGVMLVNGIH